MNLYYGLFNSKEDVANQFNVSLESNVNILYAEYNNEDYSGYATVIFEKDNKLFEVHGSHCSCDGLENQWSPESCTVEDVIQRADNGNFPYVDCGEIKRTVENWNLTSNLGLNLDFDFDNLPDSKEIVDRLNVQKILDSKEYFINKEDVIKNIKKDISEAIKTGVVNNLSSVEVVQPLQINQVLKNNLPVEKLQKLILSEFKEIQDVLLNKNWKTNLSLTENSVVFDIKIPTLTQINKKSKTKRML